MKRVLSTTILTGMAQMVSAIHTNHIDIRLKLLVSHIVSYNFAIV
jgi:hypothetical protein